MTKAEWLREKVKELRSEAKSLYRHMRDAQAVGDGAYITGVRDTLLRVARDMAREARTLEAEEVSDE